MPLLFFILCLLLPPESHPENTDLLRQGLVDLQANRFVKARNGLEAAAKVSPSNALIWVSLARTYWRLNDKPKALASAQTAARLGADNSLISHALAMFYVDAGDFPQAAHFEELYATSKSADVSALARAADLYLNAGEPAKALQVAQQAIQTNPSASNQNLLGRAYLANKDLSEGVSHLASASQADPVDAAFSFDYAQALFRKGDFSTASDALKPALQAHPKDAQLELALGVARYGQRRFDDAIAAFLTTITLNPTLPQPYRFLGKMLDQSGSRLPEITQAFRAWQQSNPADFEPPLLLAKAQLAAGRNPLEAEQELKQSISLNDQYWESHFELGQLLEKRGAFQQAAPELEKSTALSPEQATPHYHLARVYDRLGRPEKAASERATHARLTAAKNEDGLSGKGTLPY